MLSESVSKKIKHSLPNKKIFILFLLILVYITFKTVVALANENIITVKTEILNVRYGPGLSHEVLTQTQENDRLFLLGEENKWYKVRLQNDQVGWVASWLVDTENIMHNDTLFIRVTGDSVNIRQFSNTEAEIVGIAYKDTELQVLYQENDWYQVIYMGRVAWIHSNYAEKIDSPIPENDNIKDKPEKNNDIDTIKENVSTLAEATIVFDPGHGGKDPGSIAINNEFYEKEIALNTAKLLASRLEDSGANVVLTRSDDQFISLDDRIHIAHNYNADLFISLHYDAMENANMMSGTTTYYFSENNLELANTINEHLAQNSILPNNGVRIGNYYVLTQNKQPAILLELGYTNNHIDIEHINTEVYQMNVVESIYQGLKNYYQ